jgi:hypothetical protein
MSLCVFNQRYIVKLGGNYGNLEHDENTELEVYSIKEDKWFWMNSVKGVAVQPGYQ